MEEFIYNLVTVFATVYENLASYFTYDENAPLLFSSSTFLFTFFVFFAIYSLIYKKNLWRKIYVVLFSLFFYYKAGGNFVLILMFVTALNFFLALLISITNIKFLKRTLLIISIISNLSILSYFKYFGFFIRNINVFTGSELSIPDIILPIGISFYIFQAISYCADVHKKNIEVEKNFLDFAFYLCFFPQLVAGPIVRAKDFIPQIKNTPKIGALDVGTGIFLILSGLLKKCVVSDFISLNLVDRVFASPAMYTSLENLLAVYAYSMQIYCDFSGYSDMAIGLAMILGYRIPANFDAPFKSKSVTEFWRRWHISLSSWLRDYIYIPLGGNRNGIVATYVNLFLVMLIGGLWHGANWKFVLWGAMHGAALMLERIIYKKNTPDFKIFNPFLIFITFNFVTFTFIFFRAADFETAMAVINKISEFNFDVNNILEAAVSYKYVVSLILIAFVSHFTPSSVIENIKVKFSFAPFWVKAAAVGIVFRITYLVSTSGAQPFIYFQF